MIKEVWTAWVRFSILWILVPNWTNQINVWPKYYFLHLNLKLKRGNLHFWNRSNQNESFDWILDRSSWYIGWRVKVFLFFFFSFFLSVFFLFFGGGGLGGGGRLLYQTIYKYTLTTVGSQILTISHLKKVILGKQNLLCHTFWYKTLK